MKPPTLINARVIGSDIDPSVYHRQAPDVKRGDNDFVMSRSELMDFYDNPRVWVKYGKQHEGNEWGSLIDTLLLSPKDFDSRYQFQPLTYKNEDGDVKPWNNNAKVCREWNKVNAGKETIKEALKSEADSAIDFLMDYGEIRNAITYSLKQTMVIATYVDYDTKLEIPLKILLDIVPTKFYPNDLGDVKTTKCARPDFWQREIFTRNYDAQGAMYLDVYNAATDEGRTGFFHIVQENVYPYEVMTPMPMMSQEYLDVGRNKYINALRKYCQCLKNNEWPGYSIGDRKHWKNDFFFIKPEPWMMDKTVEWPSLPQIEPLPNEFEDSEKEVTP